MLCGHVHPETLPKTVLNGHIGPETLPKTLFCGHVCPETLPKILCSVDMYVLKYFLRPCQWTHMSRNTKTLCYVDTFIQSKTRKIYEENGFMFSVPHQQLPGREAETWKEKEIGVCFFTKEVKTIWDHVKIL